MRIILCGQLSGPADVCRLIWVRHARPEGAGLFLGQSDVPLSRFGRRQIPRLVEKVSLYPAQAVYTSDLLRAVATAKAISRSLKTEAACRPGLREIQLGRWEGLSWAEIAERFPEAARRWMKNFPRKPAPGGEEFRIFKARVRHELREIIAAHRGGCAVVVTHAGVIRLALADALGMPDRYLSRVHHDFGGMTIIDYFSRGAMVHCVNV